MAKNFSDLIALENLDIEIAKLQKSKKSFPLLVSEMQQKLDTANKKYDSAEKELTTLESEKSKNQQEVKDNKEGLKNSHNRLSLVKTNREYDAILLEINDRKSMIEKSNKKLERGQGRDKTLTIRRDEQKEIYDTLSSELQPQIDEMNVGIKSIDGDIEDIKTKRGNHIEKIPTKYFDKYSIINQHRRSGHSLSVIDRDTANCGYCRMTISPKTHKFVETSDSPVLCENCGSLFIWTVKEKTEEVK